MKHIFENLIHKKTFLFTKNVLLTNNTPYIFHKSLNITFIII